MQSNRHYERGLLRGIARYSQLHGPWQFLRSIPYVSGGDALSIDHLLNWEPDGLIVREGEGTEALLGLELPAVVSPYTDVFEGRCNIVVDDQTVGRVGVRYFLDRGFKHLAFCGMDELFFWSRGRRDGFAEAGQEAGHEVHVYHPPAPREHINWSRDLKALGDWLRVLPTPLGLMVCNDDFALFVAEACKLAGRSVPEDVALLGVGNDEAVCELTATPLSSVRLNTEHAGYECGARLMELMLGRRGSDRDVVVRPAGIIERRSTDVLAMEDRHVAMAIRFIRDHATQPIHVNDVVAAVPLSRRALYNRFRSVTGNALYEYIRHARLDAFTRLLLETNLTIAQIAESLGFPDEKNVARYFRKVRGLTPLVYRRRHGTVAPTAGGID
jgi:LacI family transcriptional regulator